MMLPVVAAGFCQFDAVTVEMVDRADVDTIGAKNFHMLGDYVGFRHVALLDVHAQRTGRHNGDMGRNSSLIRPARSIIGNCGALLTEALICVQEGAKRMSGEQAIAPE